jgi:uncharacterized protein YbbC (DUF1343 family)
VIFLKLGLEVLLDKQYKQFNGKRIGLVTNLTGVNSRLIPSIDLFHSHPDIDLVALYAPEHGIRGDAKEGEKVEYSIDSHTNLPVYSLYGENKKPTYEMLEPVDVIVFDLQDIGARYYTYIYTMAYVMEACAEFERQFVVLDRPNPISGVKMEGNLVDKDIKSFVGLYPIPNRHGMTVGEIALMYKYEFNINCDLSVISMEDWKRNMYFEDTGLFWVSPSPASTSIDMCTLYPGTCLIEGTNLSEGRGTTRPFEYIGAPYIDSYQLAKRFNEKKLPGILARPIYFKPAFQKHNDAICGGVQLHVADRFKLNSFQCGLTLIELIAEMYPNDFEFIENKDGKYFFDLLAGTRELRDVISRGSSIDFLLQCNVELQNFKEQREPYLLYK